MGAAQSAGGAATSGANISGGELAEAICFAAKHDDAAKDVDELTFEASYGGTETPKTMRITSYAPAVFAKMRAAEGVSDDRFVEEWTLPPEKRETKLGEGRSMAMFLKSANMDFMCKTISAVEVDVLRTVLKQYVDHVVANPNSLMMRFLMLLKIEANNDIGFLLIFSDSFARATKINERWDIKGRIPKPGKFRFFPPKDVEGHHALPRLNDPSEEHPPASPSSSSIRTKKDKELTRLFWMETAERDQLLADLNKDFDFLSGNGLMDYSILVGVRYNEDVGKLPEMRQDAHLSFAGSSSVGSLSSVPPCETRPSTGRGSSAQHKGTSKYHEGVVSVLGEETYYIAIIDMLTIYNGKKMSANFFKGFLWDADTLSTIPPAAYRERISTYANLIMASPDDDLTEVAKKHDAAR